MDYKRLTERRGGLVIDKCGNCENVSNPMGCTESRCYEIMKNRLAELEDKIEQGTLIELPCKVGDTVYCLCKDKYVLIGEKTGWTYRIEKIKSILWTFSTWEYGKTLFLTREEAEKRLKELQE